MHIEVTPEQEAAALARIKKEAAWRRVYYFTGAKYDPDRSPAEVVRLIRAEIAQAMSAGTLKRDKYVVTLNQAGRISITTSAYRAYLRRLQDDPGLESASRSRIAEICDQYDVCCDRYGENCRHLNVIFNDSILY